MMNLTILPKSFWGYALESAARILNMVPTKKVERTPYEIWHGKDPKLSYLRVWGCEALIKRDTPDKLVPDSLSVSSLTLQEASGSHGLLKASGSDVHLKSSRAQKEQSLFIVIGKQDRRKERTKAEKDLNKRHDEVEPTKVEDHSVEVLVLRSGRISQAPDRYGFYLDAKEHELGDHNEPPNYKGALPDPEFDKWLDAMNTEMQSMKDNQVWCLVDIPPNGRTIRNLAEAAYILGIKITHDRSKRLIALSQSAYFDKILNKFKMENSKRGSVPMQEKPDYRKSQCAKTPSEVKRMQNVPYASAIGYIMYVTVVKTILKYLWNTKDMVLVYGEILETELKITCYADAGFQTDKDDTKSQSGYVFVINEAEYIVAAEASIEAV
ncbi:hypothetical protein Tco_0173467 [Tanacetum coccineum]